MLYQKCSNCGESIQQNAKFCSYCGTLIEDDEAVEKEYLGHWMRALRQRIQEDHQAQNLDDYLSTFYESGFHKTFHSAATTLKNEVKDLLSANIHQAEKKAEILVRHRISDLLDYFIIHHCKDFNTIILPEVCLKYQQVSLKNLPFLEMILAYLNLESEELPYFIDFIKMPVPLLKNASNNFLFPQKDEKIWLIVDLSGMDTCKEGFALTEKAIYWKAPFEKAKTVYFINLQTIKTDENWLLINDFFFNANPQINLKLLYLLRKLKQVHTIN